MVNPTEKWLNVPSAVFRTWHFREQIEVEAASVFYVLGQHLSVLWGADDPVTKLAFSAQQDELRHQKLCRAILEYATTPYGPVKDPSTSILGPLHLSTRERALYMAVAMGCVTETLSSALLLEMQRRAKVGIIKDTIHSILRDEINHARIGWAELSRAEQHHNIDWLNDHLTSMLSVAFASDIEPMLNQDSSDLDLSPFGILRRSEAIAIMKRAVTEVITPGLKRYGLILEGAERFL